MAAAALRAPAAREAVRASLDMLEHDPLLQWTLGDTSKAAAARAAERIRLRVDGCEGLDALSVEGTVGRLIADATDGARLAQMEHRWQAWL
jgi:phosphatidylinositol kinase/protein kinase (PI-3  family)